MLKNINNLEKKYDDFSINKKRLDTYYNIGKKIELDIHDMICDYYNSLESYIKSEVPDYDIPSIEKIHQFYLIIKNGIPLYYDLKWGHYKELIKLYDLDLIEYYQDIAKNESLSVNELHDILQQELNHIN